MATYKCKKDKCPGQLSFPENWQEAKVEIDVEKATEFFTTRIDEKPQHCPVCGKAYYLWELTS